MNAAYFRDWRAAHPEYRDREKARSRARVRTPAQRADERQRAKARATDVEATKDWHRQYMRTWHDPHKAERTKRWYERNKADYLPALAHRRRERHARAWLDEAHRIVSAIISPDRRSDLYRPVYEECVSEALVVLMAHIRTHTALRIKRVVEAVRAYLRDERAWAWHTAPLLDAHLEVPA